MKLQTFSLTAWRSPLDNQSRVTRLRPVPGGCNVHQQVWWLLDLVHALSQSVEASLAKHVLDLLVTGLIWASHMEATYPSESHFKTRQGDFKDDKKYYYVSKKKPHTSHAQVKICMNTHTHTYTQIDR